MDESETLEVNTDYLKVLQEHVDSTYDHLQGFNPSAGIPFASYFPHRSFWTSEEKDIFFHGLAVHSRLRPDLIAADLPNKSVVDVSLFLGLLEEASKEERGGFSKKSFAPALETSEKWMEWEEEQARRISLNQPFWEDRSRHKERARTARALWPSFEPSKRRKIAGDFIRENEKPYYDEMHAHWNKEDYLKDLSVLHLRAIDHILRESEEPSILLGGEYTLEVIKDEDELEAGPPVDPCIDPALLEPSTERNAVAAVEDGTTDSRPMSPAVEDEESVEDPQTLTPRSRRRFQKRLYMRRKRAALNGAAPSTAVSRLKPGRKTNKRGVQITPDVFSQAAGDEGAENDSTHGEGEEIQEVEESLVVSQGAGGTTPHYKIIQQLKDLGVNASTLADDRLGLFHLSNLGKLMEIYASLDGSPASPDVGSCISASTIQLLHALVAHFVTDAVSKSISMREQEQASKGHTKVWRMSSGQIPATTVREAIDLMGAQKDVKFHFRKLYERAQDSSTQSAEAPPDTPNADNEELSGSEDEEIADKTDEPKDMRKDPHLPSGHRELYGPIVRSVPFTTMSKQFSPFFKLEDANACLEADDELMADETDDEELQRELDEEEEIDKMDEMVAQEAERELWSRVQLDAPATQDTLNHGDASSSLDPIKPDNHQTGAIKGNAAIAGEGGKLRFSNPGRKGIIKSAVYIDDSD